MIRIPPTFGPALPPLAILIVASLLLWIGPGLPPTLAGLKEAGAYFVLIAAAGMSLWFNRGRAFVAAVSLLLAYFGYRLALDAGPDSFAVRAVYTAAVVLVPLNVLVALVMPERGVSYHGDHRWLFIVAGEILLVLWIASAGQSDFSGASWKKLLDHWLLSSPPAPFLGRVLFCAAFTAAVWRAWPPKGGPVSPLAVGTAGALVAFFIGCEGARNEAVFGVFTSAAGVTMVVAMLQESHRLAFNDELTGLPGRRALQEAMAGLGPQYAIAMADVDHFKSFNDTHGHDIGDQVLKLVAARLAEIEGGGRAFRYGGEEFTVLFPNRTLKEAWPHLQAIRASVEAYQMAVRGEDRPKQKEEGEKLRAGPGGEDSLPPEKLLSVTVSIGVAEPGEDAKTPTQVLKAADQALYRAKQGGRNRVSR